MHTFFKNISMHRKAPLSQNTQESYWEKKICKSPQNANLVDMHINMADMAGVSSRTNCKCVDFQLKMWLRLANLSLKNKLAPISCLNQNIYILQEPQEQSL